VRPLAATGKYLDGFVSLFYPKTCITCGNVLAGREGTLCVACMSSLPETGYHNEGRNPVEELFYGRLQTEKVMALLFFDKGSRYRKLLYQLKYHDKPEIGIFLGRLIGSRLSETFTDYDLVIPIPLHKTRLRKRGYNQSALIAQGIAEILHIPVREDLLIRKIFNPTQTRKGRYQRWENVEGIFDCPETRPLENKHVLLVDDVITTGSTLEAAGSCMVNIPGIRISIAAVAYATA